MFDLSPLLATKRNSDSPVVTSATFARQPGSSTERRDIHGFETLSLLTLFEDRSHRFKPSLGELNGSLVLFAPGLNPSIFMYPL